MTLRGWTRFFRRGRGDQDLDREIESYVELEIADNLARGLNEQEARAAALRKFGNRTAYREAAYDMRTVQLTDTIWRNLTYGVRQLRRSPAFTATAILSLALGIGANCAVFQLLNAVRLRSLPVQNPRQLAAVIIDGGNRGFGSSPGNFEETNPLWDQIRVHQQPFSNVFAWGTGTFQLGDGASVRPARVLYASGGMFATLGIGAFRGRVFSEEDDRRGCSNSPAVISYAMWQSEFAGQESAIGAKILINQQPLQIVGVAPPEFFGLEVGTGFDIAIPNCARGRWGTILEARHVWTLNVVGRLKPDWSMERAAEYLKAASPNWFAVVTPTGYDASGLATWNRFRLTAEPGGRGVSGLRSQYERSLWLLLGITGLVLLLACANLANLLLARGALREREMAVRLAIGASRTQIAGQLFTESLLLAAAGAFLAAGVSQLLSRALVQFLSTKGNTVQLNFAMDARVWLFISAVAILTCLLFGLAPALKSSRGDAFSAMKAGGRTQTANRTQFSLQRLMIVSQVAFSLMLLVGALLFARSFRNLATLDPGFQQDGMAFYFVNFNAMRPTRAAIRPLQSEILEKVRHVPGIAAAATSTHLPLSGNSWSLAVLDTEGKRAEPRFTWVSPGYFQTMQVHLRAGRDFEDRDTTVAAKVLIVNEAFAAKLLPGGNPIGRSVRSLAEPGFPEATYEVVGVVADTRYTSLRDPAPAIAYAPELQNPQFGPGMTIVARSSIPTANAMSAVRRAVLQSWPAARMDQVEFRAMVNDRLLRERLLAWVSGFFGILAFALATLGLYGVISHIVASRRNEVGIRIALGANRGEVIGLFLRQVALLLLAGISIGALGSLLLSRGATTLLFDIQPNDPWTIAVAAGVLAAAGLMAALIPSVRASRLDPANCLRTD